MFWSMVKIEPSWVQLLTHHIKQISPILEHHRHHTYNKAQKADEFSSFVAVILLCLLCKR